jgi:hypothetical protein
MALEHLALVINGTPEIAELTVDSDEDLVEMPRSV